MTDTEALELARSLSEAQKRALLWCNSDGSPKEHDKGAPRAVSFYVMVKVITGKPWIAPCLIYSLVKQGTGGKVPGSVWPVTTWTLTPLGLRVRVLLSAQQEIL